MTQNKYWLNGSLVSKEQWEDDQAKQFPAFACDLAAKRAKERVTCPTCNGKGKQTIVATTLDEKGWHKEPPVEINCITCNGKKTITQDKAAQEQRMREAWCRCEVQGDPVPWRFANGAHGYDCSKCGKILQTG